nr:hypothetical protein [Tanacetum cinerariifolium]
MPEQVGVREFSPSYYTSRLGESLIISGSFDFGDCRVIYAWALEVEGGCVSSCRLLFTISHPSNNHLMLLGFRASTPPRYSPGASTPQSYSPRSSRNAECSNCKHLLDKITKFNLEANYPLNLSAKMSSFEDTFDITDDTE